LSKWFEGEDNDEDSGLPHESHMLACLAILVDAKANGNLVDDRQFKGEGYRKLLKEMTAHVDRLKQLRAAHNPKHYTIADDALRVPGITSDVVRGLQSGVIAGGASTVVIRNAGSKDAA
jgi:hypothetical protein